MLNITVKKAMMSGVLNRDFKRITSGKLAPDPPIIKANIAPIDTPLLVKIGTKGNKTDALTYKGIPITAAKGIAKGLLSPMYSANMLSGT